MHFLPLYFDDMVAIHELRNRFVHGLLTATKLPVRYSDGDKICRRRITPDEAGKIYTKLWTQKGWDKHLFDPA